MIANTALSIAATAPRTNGESARNGGDSAEAGGFASILGKDEGRTAHGDVAQRSAPAVVASHDGKGGKAGGKNLPADAVAQPSMETDNGDDIADDPITDGSDETEILALMLAANLPAAAPRTVAEGAPSTPPADDSTAATTGAAAPAIATGPAPTGIAMAVQQQPHAAAPAVVPTEQGATSPEAAKQAVTAAPPRPAQDSAQQVRLGAIEIVTAATPATAAAPETAPTLASATVLQSTAAASATNGGESASPAPVGSRAKPPAASVARASQAGGRNVLPAFEDALSRIARTDTPDQTASAQGALPQGLVLARNESTGGVPARPLAEGPQDFATLVQRINEAREAVNAQSVRTSLSHAEFGHVSLHFRPGETGMNVTLASADPHFAGSVQAAAAAASMQGGGDQPRETPFGQNHHQQQSQNQTQTMTGGQAGNQNQQSRPETADSQSRGGISNSRSNSGAGDAGRATRQGDRRGSGIYA